MSQFARNLAMTSYKKVATEVYQSSSKLRRTVMFDGGLESNSHEFSVIGVGKAIRRASQAQVTPANIPNKRPAIKLEPRELTEYLDENDQAITSVKLIRPYARTLASAVGRSVDEDIITALNTWDDAAYTLPGVAEADMTITRAEAGSGGAGNAGRVTPEHLAKARETLLNYMDDTGPEDFTCVLPATTWAALVLNEKMASADYVGGRPTETGMLSMRYGCRLIPIGARVEQGGALPANTAFFYHRNGVGLAETGMGNRDFLDWSTDRQSWHLGTKAVCGAARIQNALVVKMDLT